MSWNGHLCAGPPDGRTFPAVEHLVLDAGLVGGEAADAVQGVDLFHQVAFADSSEAGINVMITVSRDFDYLCGEKMAFSCNGELYFVAVVLRAKILSSMSQ
jgi:hypothetical protein